MTYVRDPLDTDYGPADDGKNRVMIESFPNRELVTFALNLFPRRDSLPNVLARRIASLVDLLAREEGYNDDLAKHLDEAQAKIENALAACHASDKDYGDIAHILGGETEAMANAPINRPSWQCSSCGDDLNYCHHDV